jgi:acyl-CoA hydrolase
MIAKSDLKDLGGHSEMLVDAYMDMYEAGVMNGRRKAFDKGKIAYTFAMGTRKLYDFINQNRAGASCSADYTNNLNVIAAHDKMTAVNNAVEIDLFGQVCSEAAGPRQISGQGGQLDFIYAAFHSKGGKGIICLSSMQKGPEGERSRIVPSVAANGIVSLTRSMVHYVITEYGIVDVKGTNSWQRAEKLISIAHPDVRDELIKEAERLKIWRPSNKKG